MEAIRLSSPYLASKKVMIVTDRQFNFLSVFPIAQQIFCWSHLERDLLYYLKQKANCNAREINCFSNVLKQLMQECTDLMIPGINLKKEFHSNW